MIPFLADAFYKSPPCDSATDSFPHLPIYLPRRARCLQLDRKSTMMPQARRMLSTCMLSTVGPLSKTQKCKGATQTGGRDVDKSAGAVPPRPSEEQCSSMPS